MFILSALLQAVIVSIVVIIVLLIPIFFILGKFKNKDKVSLKGVKTVVFNLNELVEDYMISTISINKTLSHEALLKALENLVNDKKIEKIIIDVDEVDLSRVHIEEIKEILMSILIKLPYLQIKFICLILNNLVYTFVVMNIKSLILKIFWLLLELQ